MQSDHISMLLNAIKMGGYWLEIGKKITILRLYHFSPVQPEFLKSRGFHLRVNPFHVDGLQMILPEKVFHERVNLVQMAVECNAITKVCSEGGAVGKITHAFNRQDFAKETGYKAK